MSYHHYEMKNTNNNVFKQIITVLQIIPVIVLVFGFITLRHDSVLLNSGQGDEALIGQFIILALVSFLFLPLLLIANIMFLIDAFKRDPDLYAGAAILGTIVIFLVYLLSADHSLSSI